MDNVTKQCVQCKKNFIITADEIALYNKLDMPQSKLCFDCLHQKHFAFWVWGKFRKGKSDLDGSSLITVMPEKSRFPLYTSKQWFSDEWDALTYGQEYDPDRSFFEQLKELQEKVPHPHQVGRNGINCDWCDDVWDSKNCYLSRSIANCEDSCFILRVVEAKDACDITYGIKVDKSYDSTYCFGVSQLKYSLNCHQCIDSAFLFDCRNVQNSFMCWNLRNKSYCWNNKQLTKDEYNKKLSEYDLGSWKVVSELYIKFEKILREEAIHKENFNLKVNYSTGNYIRSCNRCINTFYWENSENCYNCMRGLDSKDLINVTGNWKMELAGNNAHCVDGYFQKCNLWCSVCRFIEYCDQCDSCENCFGCVGLNKKNYCILNKQYTKEEYNSLKQKIINDMKIEGIYGDYFPLNMAYGGFNFSWGQIYFPIDEDRAESIGAYWENENTINQEGIPTSELPDNIKDVADDISAKALICPETGFRFNISLRELQFYREMNIPLPRLHFDRRMLNRFKKVSVIKSYPYKCVYCDKDVMAYYLPEWCYSKIACVECYQQHIS